MNTRPTPLTEAPRALGPDDHAAPPAVAAEPVASPLAAIVRLMRGRWLLLGCTAAVLSPALAVTGFLTGTKMYSAQAILRVYPQQASILYDSGNDSVLKTFDSFVKAETTYVASAPVMDRAAASLKEQFPELTETMTVDALTGSIKILRSEALIVLTTVSKDPDFAAGKLTAVTDAYLDLTREGTENLTRLRLEELTGREKELAARAAEIDRRMLEVGGEYGPSSLAKVHVEKVGQIDALVARKAEVEATLDALKQVSGASSADMADEEIMRATLLDRALADLNFDRAKREAEMISLKRRFAMTSPEVTDKLGEIEVLDRAMAARREQIKLLGQTGALTDTSSASATQSTDDIQAVLDKVSTQLAEARAEARSLNAKRVELESLEAERVEVRYLLDETRKALEVLRLESNSAMPGLTVLMAPAAVPTEPSDDSSKMQGAMGLVSGFLLAVLLVIVAAMRTRRLRYSDALWKTAHRIPMLRVIAAATQKTPDLYRREIDRVRNALKLLPARVPAVAGRGRVIAVTRLDGGSPDALAQDLANSFARARMRTVLVQAQGAAGTGADSSTPGWSDALHGLPVIPQTSGDIGCADLLPAGDPERGVDTDTGINAIRRVLGPLAQSYEVVIVNAGGLSDNLAAELILSASDFALAEVVPGQNLARVQSRIGNLDTLPRNGGAVVVTGARRDDPGIAAEHPATPPPPPPPPFPSFHRTPAMFASSVPTSYRPSRPVTRSAHKSRRLWHKRPLDLILTLPGLVALLPVFLIVALAIKLTSPGPVFFVQTRVGLLGKPFGILKFRSMYRDAEARRAAVLALSDREGLCFKSRKDPRITPVGRFLRRFSLDELPQLFNVVLGDMSLVGPRPALPEEVQNYPLAALERLAVLPGITGVWQVSGRAEIGFDEMVELDIGYVRHAGLLTDLSILARTAGAVIGGRGAF